MFEKFSIFPLTLITKKILYMGWRGGVAIFPREFCTLPLTRGGWVASQKMRDCNTQLAKKSWAQSDMWFGRDGRFSVKKRRKKWPRKFLEIFTLREKTDNFQNLRWRSVNTAKTVTGRDEWFSCLTRSPLWHPESFNLVTPNLPEGGVTPPQKWGIWGFSQKHKIQFFGGKESF